MRQLRAAVTVYRDVASGAETERTQLRRALSGLAAGGEQIFDAARHYDRTRLLGRHRSSDTRLSVALSVSTSRTGNKVGCRERTAACLRPRGLPSIALHLSSSGRGSCVPAAIGADPPSWRSTARLRSNFVASRLAAAENRTNVLGINVG